MTAKFIVASPNVSIEFTYTGLTTKIQNIVAAAAHRCWTMGYGNHGTEEIPVLFESLTNQQKLNIVDEFIKNTVVYTAKTDSVSVASNAAQEIANEATITATADAELNLSL